MITIYIDYSQTAQVPYRLTNPLALLPKGYSPQWKLLSRMSVCETSLSW